MFWVDASRLDAAYLAAGRAAPLDGSELGVWYDGSGRGRDAAQRARASQPRVVRVGDGALVRFDGVDDVLLAAAGLAAVDRVTLFVRAAPRSNAGGFRALVAANETGRNDFTSGFTVDLSWAPSSRLEAINVEGRGFGGAVDLLDDPSDFGTFRTFEVTAAPGPGGVALTVDGVAQARRDRGDAPLALDELSVGARFYSNTSDVPCSTGFLDGDVAEVLLYDRPLSDPERARVRQYLATKHAPLERALAAAASLRRVALEPVKPAPVQLLIPGFTARELPVELRNVNNVRYREDGTLVALGYDGDVWLLSDRDGDGLEETVRRFFENRGSLVAPIGMALTPPRYALGRGVFVACKGKVVLLADGDGDDAAEREVVVASGWAPGAIAHDVDALGVAVAPDGRLFFGLGTSDYTNGYLLDRDGRAHYDLASERGTILEVAPDFSSRRIHCTGIRFPVALAFDRAGRLFATDQEGATWLPNGNPFDELLQIEPGRHYGFPPRHPRHLPGVIDEPSLFDYGPQHESTCGLCFDEPVGGAPPFGPPRFEGDAFVAGYARGKLWRTELARSRAGLVARSELFARFDQLACDVALSPRGDLVVALHGGMPDWGSGPSGPGKLQQLRWSERDRPLPVAVWAAGPQEVRIAFDRELEPAAFEGAASRARVTFGEAVAAADRFEVHRPGYAVVERQLAAPRYDLPVHALKLMAIDGERRTLRLDVAAHAMRAPHALELPDLDLAYELGGVEAEWRSEDGSDSTTTVLPHLDLAVARELTAGSREHDALWAQLARRGTLTLRGALDVGDLLRPKVQPGATIDHVWPEEKPVVELRSGGALDATVEGAELSREGAPGGPSVLRAAAGSPHGPVAFELTLATGAGPVELDVAFFTAEDARARPLELRRFVLPWAARLGERDAASSGAASEATPRPELAGASWSRGRAVFFGDDAMCSRCHTLQDGTPDAARAKIGPDLSRLWQRDFASVKRDVLQPSAALNPDHVTWAITLRDGRELAGVTRTDPDGSLVIGQPGGKETRVAAADVVARAPLAISIMPAGLQNVLSPRQVTDLLAYVLSRPLEPAPIAIDGAPKPRDADELAKIVALARSRAATTGAADAAAGTAGVSPAPDAPAAVAPLHVLLLAGPKDHGPDEHDYPDWQRRWSELLQRGDDVTVASADGWPSSEQLARADAMVIYSANPGWSAERGAELDAFLARGGGLVLLHYAVNGRDAVPELARRIGLSWRDGASRFRHGPVRLEVGGAARRHPIVRGLDALRLELVDETYWGLEGDAASIEVLATSDEEDAPQPQLWTREVGGGRVFVSLLGHYRWTFDDPLFRLVVLRAIAWSARRPASRLAELALVGCRS